MKQSNFNPRRQSVKNPHGESHAVILSNCAAQLALVGRRFCWTRAPRCDESPLKPLLPHKN
jgi:hypothetical protein